MSRSATAVRKLLSWVIPLAFLACSGDDLVLPEPGTPSELGTPADIEIVKGDDQSGAPGTMLRDSIVVRVTDSDGAPLPGQLVEFLTTEPGAAITPQTATTGPNGIAGARWVLGTTSGTQRVIARVVGDGVPDGIEATFEASVRSADAARIEVASGNDQAGAVGTALPNPLVVLVTDQFGNPVADILVDWETEDGSVNPSSSRTGLDGRAETSWLLGSSSGSQTATASIDGLDGSPVIFAGTAIPGSANGLVRVSGNGQSGRPGEELDQPLVVRLVDRHGNGIPNQAVTWLVGAGGGSVASTTSITDGDGEARTRWTLGPAAGTNTLNAVVSGVGIVGFTATAVAGGGGGGSTPTRMEFRVQPTDLEHRHQIISPPVVVVVLDQFGNLVTDREFTIRLDLIDVRSGRSMGHDERRIRSGVATFADLRINPAGEFRLRASTAGLPSVDSNRFDVAD